MSPKGNMKSAVPLPCLSPKARCRQDSGPNRGCRGCPVFAVNKHTERFFIFKSLFRFEKNKQNIHQGVDKLSGKVVACFMGMEQMKIHGYILFLSGSDDDQVVIATNERKRIVEEAISAFSVEGREQRILDAIEENEANETTTRPIGQRCVLCVVHVT